MRRVAGQQDPSLPPPVGHDSVERVDELPLDLDLIDVDVLPDEPADGLVGLEMLLVVVGQGEFEAVVATGLRRSTTSQRSG